MKILFEKSIGYHAGDLGKAEGRWEIMSSDRGTGHFGTGTYFVGNPEEINYGNYKDRPHHEVDFDKYTLYTPYDTKSAFQLHDFLRNINYNIKYYEVAQKPTSYIIKLRNEFNDLLY